MATGGRWGVRDIVGTVARQGRGAQDAQNARHRAALRASTAGLRDLARQSTRQGGEKE